MTRLAMFFPGQGSQHTGMGQTLYDTSAAARLCFEEAEDTLGMDIKKLCFSGTFRDLSRVDLMQIALLTVCKAAFSVYMEEIGILPDFAAGHSLGEYSALACSGVLGFADALRIVELRGRLTLELAERDIGCMMVVQDADEEELIRLCGECSAGDDIVAPACFNSPRQTVVAGTHQALARLEAALWQPHIVTTPLYNSAPFHTPLMNEAAQRLAEAVAACAVQPLRFPVLSGVTAAPYRDAGELAASLGGQLVRPVQWRKILDYAESRRVDAAIEMGPKSVLSMLVKENGKPFAAVSYSVAGDAEQLPWLAPAHSGLPATGSQYHFIELCLGIAVSVKNLNPDSREYELGAAQPYEQLERLADEADAAGLPPTVPQMREALRLLMLIMDTKRVPPEERKDYYGKLLRDTGTASVFQEEIDVEPKLVRTAGSS